MPPVAQSASRTRPSPPAGPLGLLAAAYCTFAAGCLTIPAENPDYAASTDEVDADYLRMERSAVGLQRPVVILNGYRSPPLMALNLKQWVQDLTGADDRQVLSISYPFRADIPTIAEAVAQEVDQHWPSQDPARTIEVDVIGISMGGIVARQAALPPATDLPQPPAKQLRIARLFTLATPHRGAVMSEYIRPDEASRQLRAGSDLLQSLDSALPTADYQMVCYARLNDRMVGARNSAPLGAQPIWVPGLAIGSHFGIANDRRILVDIARRLRGEQPLARSGNEPPTD